jgi:hypothetical protein
MAKTIYEQLIQISDETVKTIMVATCDLFAPLYLVIYLAMTYYYFQMLMEEKMQANIFSFWTHIIMFFFSYWMLQGDNMYSYLYKPLRELVAWLPDFIGGIVNKKQSGVVFNAVDNISTILEEIQDKYAEGQSMFSFNKYKIIITCWIIDCIATLQVAYYGALLFLANIASAIIFCMAPIAVPLATFREFRGLLFNMLKSFWTYSLPPAIACLILSFATIAFNANIDSIAQDLSVGDSSSVNRNIMGLLAIVTTSFFLLTKSSEIASHLISGPLASFGQTMGGITSNAWSVSKYGASAGGKAVGSAAGQYRSFQAGQAVKADNSAAQERLARAEASLSDF